MAGLSLQDKLALAHTSLSQRMMGAYIGVSPRTISRWLREGQPEGVSRIPREARNAIEFVYRQHLEICRAAERATHIPPRDDDARKIAYDLCTRIGVRYHDNAFALALRKPLKTGWLGNRVFIERAQFLRRELRLNIIAGFVARGYFVTGSIVSDVQLSAYADDALARKLEELRASGKSLSAEQRALIAEWSWREKFGDLDPSIEPDKIITVNTAGKRIVALDILTWDDATFGWKGKSAETTAEEILKMEDQYRTRHEPSAVRGAHTIILQLQNVYANANNSKAPVKTRKAARNRKGKR